MSGQEWWRPEVERLTEEAAARRAQAQEELEAERARIARGLALTRAGAKWTIAAIGVIALGIIVGVAGGPHVVHSGLLIGGLTLSAVGLACTLAAPPPFGSRAGRRRWRRRGR